MGVDFYEACIPCRAAYHYPGVQHFRASVFVHQHGPHGDVRVVSEYSHEGETFWFWDQDERRWFTPEPGSGDPPAYPDPTDPEKAFVVFSPPEQPCPSTPS